MVQESTESIWLRASIIIRVWALVSREEMHMPARSSPIVELPARERETIYTSITLTTPPIKAQIVTAPVPK